MRVEKGSLTVEAAIVFPIVLIFFAMTMRLGITLYEECRETAIAVMEEPELDTVETFYKWKLLGEWVTDGN